jgi:aspartyl protease family protein
LSEWLAVVLWICLFLLLIGGVAAFAVGDSGSIGGLSGDMIAGIAASLALLVFFGSSILSDYNGKLKGAVRDIALWAGFALLLVVLYSFRNEAAFVFDRVAGELLPPGQALSVSGDADGKHVVRIRKRGDEHFSVRADINNARITLLVDTGASTVVLKPADARAVGIDTSQLAYTVPVNTANGSAFAASVRLPEIRIGPIVVQGVEALVSKPGALKESLLGMNFLRRLRSYEFSGEFLTLRS